MTDLPPLYDQSDYEALREDLEETIARQTESALDANEALYAKGERVAALEAIVGRQEEELRQSELRVAGLEARIQRDEKYRDELLERRAESVERAEQAEAELRDYAKTVGNLRRQVVDLKKIVGKQEHELDDLRLFWTATMIAVRFSFDAEPRDPQVSLNELRDEINAADNVLDEKVNGAT